MNWGTESVWDWLRGEGSLLLVMGWSEISGGMIFGEGPEEQVEKDG